MKSWWSNLFGKKDKSTSDETKEETVEKVKTKAKKAKTPNPTVNAVEEPKS